jgi:hypothetical protein
MEIVEKVIPYRQQKKQKKTKKPPQTPNLNLVRAQIQNMVLLKA